MENRQYQVRRPVKKRPPQGDMAFGVQPVLETLRSGKEIERLFIQREMGMNEIVKLAESREIAVHRVPLEKLNRLTRKNHQGVVCFLSPIRYAPIHNVLTQVYEEGKVPFFLLLDRVTDVRNFGAIVRTAACAGVQAVIIPSKGGAMINADAMKTSSGALNYMPICREESLVETVRYLTDSGLQCIACTEKATKPIYALDFRVPTVVVMGSEEDGISEELIALSGERALIPLMGEVDSLNVSAAASVILYEGVRQRLEPGN
jgi:23S rRNA (guanosine2251-2'-O)-methyltransferase